MANKVIRLDPTHYLYLVDTEISAATMDRLGRAWQEFWPGTELAVMQAGAYIDQLGEAELVTAEQLDG